MVSSYQVISWWFDSLFSNLKLNPDLEGLYSKYWNPEITMMQKHRQYFAYLVIWKKVEHMFWYCMLYCINVIKLFMVCIQYIFIYTFLTGPWFVGEVIENHIGVVFAWGTFVNRSYLPGSLTYAYGFFQVRHYCQWLLMNMICAWLFKNIYDLCHLE